MFSMDLVLKLSPRAWLQIMYNVRPVEFADKTKEEIEKIIHEVDESRRNTMCEYLRNVKATR